MCLYIFMHILIFIVLVLCVLVAFCIRYIIIYYAFSVYQSFALHMHTCTWMNVEIPDPPPSAGTRFLVVNRPPNQARV